MIINRDEVMRYLGYRNQPVDDKMLQRIDECIDEAKSCIMKRYRYRVLCIHEEQQGICLKDYDYTLGGKDIKKHLEGCSTCAIMAVTLGVDIDNKIRYYEKTDMTKALILDACGTTAVEEICDDVEEIIRRDAGTSGKSITYRYSPGYGDLALENQDYILRLLEADKNMGLTVNLNHILIPRKSVTAIIGFREGSVQDIPHGCENCSKYDSCNFRKGGNSCGL